MRQLLSLTVAGGTTHTVPMDRLLRLQALVSEFGTDTYPLFLRMGAVQEVHLQPVTARALLAEVEKFMPRMRGRRVPGLSFRDAQGREIGVMHGGPEPRMVAENAGCVLSLTEQGIRVVLRQFPPPVGFRSSPALESGWYECFFERLQHTPSGVLARRTPAMGGSGNPVALANLPNLPPPTRWDESKVATGATVAVTELIETPAEGAFRDVLHAVTAACNEGLRLRRPLRIRRE